MASTDDASGMPPRSLFHSDGLAVMNEPLPLAPLQGLQRNSISCRWLERLRKPDKYTVACLITFLVGTVQNNGLIIGPQCRPRRGHYSREDLRSASETSCSSLLITDTAALPPSPPSIPPSLAPPPDKKKNTTHNCFPLMQRLSFPSRQKQPLISLRHRAPSFP